MPRARKLLPYKALVFDLSELVIQRNKFCRQFFWEGKVLAPRDLSPIFFLPWEAMLQTTAFER
jgi:hypothetical protein